MIRALKRYIALRRLAADKAMRERLIGRPFKAKHDAAKRGWAKRRGIA